MLSTSRASRSYPLYETVAGGNTKIFLLLISTTLSISYYPILSELFRDKLQIMLTGGLLAEISCRIVLQ